MKTLFFIFGFFILSTFLSSGVAFAVLIQQEEEGFETQLSTTPSSQSMTLRDIPEGGLLLIPDSQNYRVMAFDPQTGDLYDENFIPSDPTNLSTPIQAALHPDGNSILISDQFKDGVIGYDLDGNFIGWFAPAGGVNNAILDNVRGWGLKADGNILVTTAGGSNSDAIVEFDTSGNNIGNFIANGAGGLDGPWDILYRPDHNDYLVTASSSGGIHRYDMNGVYLGDFATGFSFTEQITEIESGNILVASFSAPSGVHEFASDGTFIGYYDIVGSLRGVYELPNGNILVTNSGGVYEINRNNTIVSTKISGVNARSINFVEPVSPFPPPTNVAVDEEIGTVYWDPPEMVLTRDLTGYNIYLDGVLIVANILPSPLEYQYQYLIPGQTYIAGVSAVYDDPGESEIVEVEFIYSYVIFAPPENLTATVVNYNEVELAWEPPSGNNRALSGYKVYRDAIEIYEITDPLVLTYLDDEGLDAGDYEYYVTAVYVDPTGESVPSNIEEVTITLPAPVNATATYIYPNVILEWDEPIRGLEYYNLYRNGELEIEGITNTFYIITNVLPGISCYNVTALYSGGYESGFSNDMIVIGPSNVDNVLIPISTELTGNYPNPFNPTTTITYSVNEAGKVSIEIYNIKGQKVKTLVNEVLPAGEHSVVWDGKNTNNKAVASGIYFYKLKAGEYSKTRKMLLLR